MISGKGYWWFHSCGPRCGADGWIFCGADSLPVLPFFEAGGSDSFLFLLFMVPEFFLAENLWHISPPPLDDYISELSYFHTYISDIKIYELPTLSSFQISPLICFSLKGILTPWLHSGFLSTSPLCSLHFCFLRFPEKRKIFKYKHVSVE